MMAEQGQRSRILVVDDNQANAELLKANLVNPDWEIAIASSGTQALAEVARAEPDIILLDIMMPDISGYEVCRRIKTDGRLRDVPIIMVTALTEVEDVEKAVEAGTDDFLSKPVNRVELITRVKSLLKLRHLKNELAKTLSHLDELERGARDRG
jgi:two-component system, OmpR family, alkaline phosphatase synthesis response regulator PhoP